MKTTIKYFLAVILGVSSLSACTMGDKGSEKKPDSVTIDTSVTPSKAAAEPSDTTLIDSLQTDTSKTGVKP